MGFSAFISTLLAAQMGPENSGTLAVAAGVLAFCGAGAAALEVWAFRSLPFCPREILGWTVGSVMALAACAVVLGLYCWTWHAQVEPAALLDGGEVRARLRILDYPEERYHRYYYQAQVVRVNGMDAGNISIRLSCREPLYCQPYDQLEVQAVFYRFQESGAWFSTRKARLAQKNVLGAYLTGAVERRVPERVYEPGRLAALLRGRVSRGLARYLPREEAGLAKAVLLGDTSDISAGAGSCLARVGASHLVAVSGLHISILAAFVLWLVRRAPLGRWGRFLICCGALLCYLCLIGYKASALRGSLMFFLTLLAKALGYREDSLNALGFALCIICVGNPFSGGDLGFVLSAGSTAGIVLLYRPVLEACTRLLEGLPEVNRLLRPLWAAVSVTLSANLFTLPIQLEAFGGISLLFIPANLLLVPLVTGLLYCALPLAALAPFPGAEPLARVFGFCTGWMARLVLRTAEALASLPGTYLYFDSLGLTVLAGMALVCLGVLLKPVRRKGLAVLLSAAVLVSCGLWAGAEALRDVLTIAMTGDGDSVCVFVMCGGRTAALSLGGWSSATAEQLLEREHIAAVESVLLPESTPQARETLTELAKACPVGRLILPEGAYVWKSMKQLDIPVEFAPLGQGWELLPGVEARLDQEGEGLTVSAGGRELDLRLGKDCGLYLSLPGEPSSSREMGILFRDRETPEWELFQGEAPGSYIVLGEQESLFLRIRPDGLVGYELY